MGWPTTGGPVDAPDRGDWSVEHEALRAGSDQLVVVQVEPELQLVYPNLSQVPAEVRDLQPELVPDWSDDELASLLGDADVTVPGVGRDVGPDDRAKRLFDIVVALVALTASLPVWVAVAVVAALGRQGPVLYAQDRVGRNGQPFRCLKFRTMYPDADRVLQQILDDDPELARQWAAERKLSGDPRITPLGRVLRRFDLDEIPQFVNVLRGEMSVVGPRPVVPGETDRFGADLSTVLSVRPGLTGLWQVSGRNEMNYGDRVRREATYVRTRSFTGDLAICLRTPRVLMRGNGER